MWEELGFLSNDEARRWSLALPAELREKTNSCRIRLEKLADLALRTVKAERLAAGLTVDASNYARLKRKLAELTWAASCLTYARSVTATNVKGRGERRPSCK